MPEFPETRSVSFKLNQFQNVTVGTLGNEWLDFYCNFADLLGLKRAPNERTKLECGDLNFKMSTQLVPELFADRNITIRQREQCLCFCM